jgi:ubiquinone/menaquinone biosynthesis C-methylase UbiE
MDNPKEKDHSLKPITSWIGEDDLNSIYTSEYWNDIAEEQKKEWWIAEGSEEAYLRLRLYLDNSGLMAEYRIAEQSISQLSESNLAVADIAAGVGWTSVLMSRLPNVGSVHAVEISRHRLEMLFPQALRMFNGEASKINRYLGSFYDIRLANASMDVVFLSQAFHHAANPLRLLTEIDRILKPGGRLMLIGENFIGANRVVRQIMKVALLERRFCSNFYELFPPDDDSGDHYYRVSDYYLFLQLIGYRIINFSIQRKQSAVVIADKSG